MIIDKLENIGLYENLNPQIQAFFEYASAFDYHGKENFKEKLSKMLSISFSKYTTKAFDEKGWEAHDHCIDIQLVLAGTETLAYANREQLNFVEKAEGKDKLVYTGDGSRFKLGEGYFAIIFPQDGHKTKLNYGEESEVIKLIGKVSI